MDLRMNNVYLYTLSSLIRISADLRIFAPPRSFSQLVTSFFGAMYLGILRMLFVAWSFIDLLVSLQKFYILTRLISLSSLASSEIVSVLYAINLSINLLPFFVLLFLLFYAVVRLRFTSPALLATGFACAATAAFLCFSDRKTLLSDWQLLYVIKLKTISQLFF